MVGGQCGRIAGNDGDRCMCPIWERHEGSGPPAEKCWGAIARRASDVPGGHQASAKGEPGESASFRRDGVVCPARAVVPRDVLTAGPRQ